MKRILLLAFAVVANIATSGCATDPVTDRQASFAERREDWREERDERRQVARDSTPN